MAIDVVPLGAAFVTGIAGSAHCALMCGGIATTLAAATQDATLPPSWSRALALNVARVAGYVVAGLVAGLLGAWVGVIFAYADLAWVLRPLLGVALILIGLRLAGARDPWQLSARWGQSLWQRLGTVRRWLLPATTTWRRLALGMLWGWLPCGLSASVLLAGWLSADPWQGALLMAAFGGGTLFAMVPLTWSGMRIARHAAGTRRLAAAFVVGAGVLVLAAPWLARHPGLARGLELLGCLPTAPS